MFVRPAVLTSRIASKRFLGVISKAELIEEAKNPDVVIIDVRDHNEVAGGTIPAASWAHFPLDEFDDMTSLNEKNFELIYEMKKPTKDQKVNITRITYCFMYDGILGYFLLHERNAVQDGRSFVGTDGSN